MAASYSLSKVGARRVYSSVMNCSFNNPKSRSFFPRSLNEEEWDEGLNCMHSTGVGSIADVGSLGTTME